MLPQAKGHLRRRLRKSHQSIRNSTQAKLIQLMAGFQIDHPQPGVILVGDLAQL
jgi:hypothetical protein